MSCVLFTYCRQEHAIFQPLIHTTWEEPFSAALYIHLVVPSVKGRAKEVALGRVSLELTDI